MIWIELYIPSTFLADFGWRPVCALLSDDPEYIEPLAGGPKNIAATEQHPWDRWLAKHRVSDNVGGVKYF
jgi:hypothetical protein